MTNPLALAKWCAGIGLTVGYILLAHYTITTPGHETLGGLLALAPIVAAALSLAWRSPHRPWMLALLGAGAVLLAAGWGTIEQHYSHIYWIEHAGTQCLLGWMFARTLAPGREPMCSFFARMVHGKLTPALARYTRQITSAWVVFFCGMASMSTLLYFTAPLASWSLFANFMTAPLTGLMFLGEYLVRRRVLPNLEHVDILMAVKAFWKSPASR